jgi:hypothetical protein
MKRNIGEVLEGSEHSLNMVLSCHLPGGTGEKHKAAGIPAKT